MENLTYLAVFFVGMSILVTLPYPRADKLFWRLPLNYAPLPTERLLGIVMVGIYGIAIMAFICIVDGISPIKAFFIVVYSLTMIAAIRATMNSRRESENQ